MATEANITSGYFTGEDKSLVFSVSNANGDPQDITGWSLLWAVKAQLTGKTLVAKTTDSGIVLTSAESGVCAVSVSAGDIAALSGDLRYYHELRRTDSGLDTVLSYGQLLLKQGLR